MNTCAKNPDKLLNAVRKFICLSCVSVGSQLVMNSVSNLELSSSLTVSLRNFAQRAEGDGAA